MREKNGVRLRLEGLGAEKLINELWKENTPLLHIGRSRKRGVEVTVDQVHFRRTEEMAREKGFQVTVLNGGWQQKIKEGLKRHWALWAGFILGGIMAGLSLTYVWQVEIINAGKYAGEVRLFLEEKGIRPGIRQKDVNRAALQEELLWRLPDVKWAFVKMDGVKVLISLEEGVAADKEKKNALDVVAAEDGVLERVTVFSGTAVCRAGDTVQKGQVLIRGEETGKGGEIRQVQAKGEAIARVWVREEIRMPTEEMVTHPTGKEAERILFQTPLGVYTWSEEPDFLMADREYTLLPLPGAWVPVTVVRERFLECSGEWVERDAQEVAGEAEKAAAEALVRAWPETADIDKSIKISMIERGIIEVVASAELTKDIAQYGAAP